MPRRPLTDWTSVEVLLTAAVLALAWPREDELLIPERRSWLGWARGLLPRARRQREEAGGREAEAFVTALTTELPMIPVHPLPSEGKVYRPERVTRSATREQAAQRPPWKTMENAGWLEPAPAPAPRRRAPGDPPTIVMEVIRPAVEADLGLYLKALPAYDDAPWSQAPGVLLPQDAAALGAPDHDGAPQDVHDDQAEEDDLAPLEPGVVDVEGQVEEAREERPGDGQLQQDGVPAPPALVPGPEEPGDERESQ